MKVVEPLASWKELIIEDPCNRSFNMAAYPTRVAGDACWSSQDLRSRVFGTRLLLGSTWPFLCDHHAGQPLSRCRLSCEKSVEHRTQERRVSTEVLRGTMTISQTGSSSIQWIVFLRWFAPLTMCPIQKCCVLQTYPLYIDNCEVYLDLFIERRNYMPSWYLFSLHRSSWWHVNGTCLISFIARQNQFWTYSTVFVFDQFLHFICRSIIITMYLLHDIYLFVSTQIFHQTTLCSFLRWCYIQSYAFVSVFIICKVRLKSFLLL